MNSELSYMFHMWSECSCERCVVRSVGFMLTAVGASECCFKALWQRVCLQTSGWNETLRSRISTRNQNPTLLVTVQKTNLT